MALYWALVGWWEGLACACHRENQVPPFAGWFIVSASEWKELRREGFYTRRQRSRPTAFVDRKRQAEYPVRVP